MKKINIYFVVAILFFGACEVNDKEPVLKESVPQELTNPTEGLQIKITGDLLDSNFTFIWSAAEYNVDLPSPNYIVELDKAANTFSDPQSLKSTNDLELAIKYTALNKMLMTDFGVVDGDTSEVMLKARVISSIGKQVELVSQEVAFSVIPYFEPDTTPVDTTTKPVADTIYLVGQGTSVGWEPNNALPIINDGTSNIYTITTDLVDGGMKILKFKGMWAPQWGLDVGDGTGGTLSYRPDEATQDPPEIPSPGTGTYRIDVNIKDLEYTITPI